MGDWSQCITTQLVQSNLDNLNTLNSNFLFIQIYSVVPSKVYLFQWAKTPGNSKALAFATVNSNILCSNNIFSSAPNHAAAPRTSKSASSRSIAATLGRATSMFFCQASYCLVPCFSFKQFAAVSKDAYSVFVILATGFGARKIWRVA